MVLSKLFVFKHKMEEFDGIKSMILILKNVRPETPLENINIDMLIKGKNDSIRFLYNYMNFIRVY